MKFKTNRTMAEEIEKPVIILIDDIEVNKELIESFEKIVVGAPNVNPVNYLDTLSSKQIAKARKLYQK